jgi:uncharacterized protein with PQ loop repeat
LRLSLRQPARGRLQTQDCHMKWSNQSYGKAMTFTWLIDLAGATGAMLTTLCWLPQVLKVVREKETRALSLPATGAFTLGVALWLTYGIAIGADRIQRGDAYADGADPGDEIAVWLAAVPFSPLP